MDITAKLTIKSICAGGNHFTGELEIKNGQDVIFYSNEIHGDLSEGGYLLNEEEIYSLAANVFRLWMSGRDKNAIKSTVGAPIVIMVK